MKKLILTLATVFFVSFAVNANNNEPSTTPACESESATINPIEEMFAKIRIHIDFGRKSKGCAGFGVCSVTIEAEIDLPISFDLSANPSQQATLEMNAAGYEKIVSTFGSNVIVVEEDYQLDRSVSERAGLRDGYTIKAGKYTVTKNSRTGLFETTF